MKVYRLIAIPLLVVCLAGCGADLNEAIRLYQEASTRAKVELDAANAEAAKFRAEAERLRAVATSQPAGAERDRLEKAAALAEKIAADAERIIAQVRQHQTRLDELAKAAGTGDVDAAGKAITGVVSGIPGVGPYAGLIGIGITALIGFWQRQQKIKALAEAAKATNAAEKIVESVELAGPDWSAADKEAIRKLQGVEVSTFVHEIKSKLGL